MIALVGVGEALALELDDGSISVSAVGALAGAALFGPRAALALAVTICVVQWSAQRQPIHRVLFNIGTLTLSSLAAAGVFTLGFERRRSASSSPSPPGLVAGAPLLRRQHGPAVASLSRSRAARTSGAVWHERFLWLAPHYLVYGFIGGVIAIGYDAAGLYALAVFAVPLLLMRKTQEAYLSHTRRSAQKLRQAAETIQTQNVSLEQANRLLKERSTAAMESLSATVDARDAYTAGHSRRVQQLALAIGRELGLSQVELDLLGHAALFHDIGKLAIPDSILLKPASLTEEEWALMQRHADEGARIIDRLGFLGDAVPAIRHHHERFDGTGYPDRLRHEEIPLGARIIHVADALDSMLTTRIYRAARPLDEALAELRGAAGTQFCPRCVAALERILPLDVAHGRAAGAAEAARDLARPTAASALSQGQTLGHVLFWRSCKSQRMLYTVCMGRSRRHPAVAGIDPEALAAFQAGIRKRYTDEEILAQLTDSAERLGRSPTMREFAADAADDGAPADGDRALRQLERGQAAGGARAAAVRDPRGAARAAAGAGRGARPHADRARHRRAQGRDARRSRSSGTRSARWRRRCGRRASTCRWGRSGWSGRSSRARRWRESSAGCRRWPTGPPPGVPTSRC